ncbi:MAG: cobalamin B12-binding domain-containing protein, partial [Firmicutes bacterium]|nr:cobalamin B12-binding domain-containing protein [Bacillota bacterium]
MKILLTTLNSKYVHSNLALKYLYTVVAGEYSDVEVREYTINNDPDYVYSELVRANYDMVCFSCYIWNIEQIKILGRELKLARPEIKICVGGPEVSYCGPEFARE